MNKSTLALLRQHGISKEAARYAGLYDADISTAELRANIAPMPDGAIVPYYPRVKGIDWPTYMSGPGSLVICNDELQALSLCLRGIPAIAIVGVTPERAREWLRELDANVSARGSVH